MNVGDFPDGQVDIDVSGGEQELPANVVFLEIDTGGTLNTRMANGTSSSRTVGDGATLVGRYTHIETGTTATGAAKYFRQPL